MNSYSIRRASVRTAALVAAAAFPGVLAAQLNNSSAAAFGLGENFLAAARGADAVEWNAANLGLRGNPGFSFRAIEGGGVSALNPVKWSDFSGYGDQSISREVRQRWLDQVTADGGESGEAEGDFTLLAFSAGRVGVSVGGAGYARATLSPDAMEALFFGNAGRTGQARDLSFAGSNARGGAFATTALSYGQPVGSSFALGFTAKYIVGGGMVHAEDAGSSVSSSNVAVSFPTVHSQADGSPAGKGLGLDLGAAWRAERLTVAVKAENVVNSFVWDESQLRYRAGSASFDGTNSASNFDEQPYTAAPQSLRDAVADERFAPSLSAGLAFERSEKLLVTADAKYALGGEETIVLGPKSRVGVGIESRAIGFLPVRVGGAVISGGWQASAGAGLRLGAFELAAAYMTRHGEHGTAPGVMFSVISVR
jgi:hypothetical protein